MRKKNNAALYGTCKEKKPAVCIYEQRQKILNPLLFPSPSCTIKQESLQMAYIFMYACRSSRACFMAASLSSFSEIKNTSSVGGTLTK